MPMITVQYSTSRSERGLKAAVAQAASDLAAQILRKDPKVTAVLVQAVDPAEWFCAGQSLAQSGLAAFWLEIRITEGTNTKDEKASFIAAVFERMEMHEIKYFLAACRTLNFHRAAELSHVSQPALTRAVQKLEAELGAHLFHRERSQIRVTDFGRLMRSHLE